jgi:hypothetical protein
VSLQLFTKTSIIPETPQMLYQLLLILFPSFSVLMGTKQLVAGSSLTRSFRTLLVISQRSRLGTYFIMISFGLCIIVLSLVMYD